MDIGSGFDLGRFVWYLVFWLSKLATYEVIDATYLGSYSSFHQEEPIPLLNFSMHLGFTNFLCRTIERDRKRSQLFRTRGEFQRVVHLI